MATTPVNTLPVLGGIQDGDLLVGEQVPGSTGLVVVEGILYDADFNASAGIMVTTAPNEYANREIEGVAGRTTVTDGTGTLGNIQVDISADYIGQSTVTTLGTVEVGTWEADIVEMEFGGTSKNLVPSNGGLVYTDADSMEILPGTSTANKVPLSGANSAPSWSSYTLPAAVGGLNTRLKSNGTNYVNSTTTMPDTGTTGKVIIGDGTNYIESTATYPVSTNINRILYSSANNVIAELATVNSGMLVTSGTGVPSISTDIPTAVTVGGQYNYRAGGTDVALADGGTGASLTAPAADRILFYDQSASTSKWLEVGSGLDITGTVLTATAAGNTTAFKASRTSTQTVTSGTATKTQNNVEEYDVDNTYDNATNFRHTPKVAGKYLYTAMLKATTNAANGYINVAIYKNGSDVSSTLVYFTVGTSLAASVNAQLNMNGSTDYVEMYATVIGTQINPGTSLSGVLLER